MDNRISERIKLSSYDVLKWHLCELEASVEDFKYYTIENVSGYQNEEFKLVSYPYRTLKKISWYYYSS